LLGYAALALCVLVVSVSATSADTARSSQSGYLVFSVSSHLPAFGGREACGGLYAVKANGGGLIRVTGPESLSPTYPVAQTFSRNGRFLAFLTVTDTRATLFNLDTSLGRVTRLTKVDFNAEAGIVPRPAWSPKTDTILLANAPKSRVGEIMSVDLRLARAAPIVRTRAPSYGFFPAWSPDGSTVSYTIASRAGWSVWLANRDGSRPRQIARNSSELVWSPRGQRVALFSPGGLGAVVGATLRVGAPPYKRSDEAARRVLHRLPGVVWSPGGDRVLFGRKPSGSYPGEEDEVVDLYVKKPPHGSERLLRRHVIPVAWSRDQRILFLRPSLVSGSLVFGVYWTRVGERKDHLLTVIDENDVRFSSYPVWQSVAGSLRPVKSSAGGASRMFAVPPNSEFCVKALRGLTRQVGHARSPTR
jgi:hypothetical protein